MFKVSHQIINEKTVHVYSALHCTLVCFDCKHTAQQCSENDLVTAESQLVLIANIGGTETSNKAVVFHYQEMRKLSSGASLPDDGGGT